MIELKNFSVSYGKNTILNNVNLIIDNLGINFLMGKNGSGKTTLIKCILDVLEFNGEIKIGFEKNHLRNLFIIFDDSPLYDNLTGIQNIMMFTSCCKKEAIEYSKEYLGLDVLNKKAKTYSYGERKKIFLIILEILRPKIIIMDEVSNGLDYETMLLLKDKVRILAKDSLILMTGHQFEFYKNIVQNVFVIRNNTIENVELYNNITLEEIYERTIK